MHKCAPRKNTCPVNEGAVCDLISQRVLTTLFFVQVGEGVLTKMCRKKPKPRQFYLFNDLLVYGNIIINKKKYNKQHIIPLEEVTLSKYSALSI